MYCIQADKVIAESKLEAAKPALEEAEAALQVCVLDQCIYVQLVQFLFLQTIKAAHIATVRKLAKPPHIIMRIMDCVLLLFQRKLDQVVADPERPCMKPSWGESLKVTWLSSVTHAVLILLLRSV